MNLFSSDKKRESILDCFTYNLTSFFYDDYKEIDSEETPATVMIVYEKELPWFEMNIFDHVQFRVFFDKENITGSNPVNVKFISKNKKVSVNDIESVVNTIFSIYGSDDYGNGKWSKKDKSLYDKGSFRRVWTIENGDSFVSLENDSEFIFSLNILFFNNILKTKGSSEVNL